MINFSGVSGAVGLVGERAAVAVRARGGRAVGAGRRGLGLGAPRRAARAAAAPGPRAGRAAACLRAAARRRAAADHGLAGASRCDTHVFSSMLHYDTNVAITRINGEYFYSRHRSMYISTDSI